MAINKTKNLRRTSQICRSVLGINKNNLAKCWSRLLSLRFLWFCMVLGWSLPVSLFSVVLCRFFIVVVPCKNLHAFHDYGLAFHDCVSDSVRSLSLMHEEICFVRFSIFCAGLGCSRCVLSGFVWFWAGLCLFSCFLWFYVFCAGLGCSRCVLFGFVWFWAGLCRFRNSVWFYCFALVSAALAAFCLVLHGFGLVSAVFLVLCCFLYFVMVSLESRSSCSHPR